MVLVVNRIASRVPFPLHGAIRRGSSHLEFHEEFPFVFSVIVFVVVASGGEGPFRILVDGHDRFCGVASGKNPRGHAPGHHRTCGDHGIRSDGHTGKNDDPRPDDAIVQDRDPAVLDHLLVALQVPEYVGAAIVGDEHYTFGDAYMVPNGDQVGLGSKSRDFRHPAIISDGQPSPAKPPKAEPTVNCFEFINHGHEWILVTTDSSPDFSLVRKPVAGLA